MLPEPERAGRIWIDERIAASAIAHGLAWPQLSWHVSAADLDQSSHTLTMRVGTREKRWTITDGDLDRLPKDATVQERIEDELAAFLHAFEESAS